MSRQLSTAQGRLLGWLEVEGDRRPLLAADRAIKVGRDPECGFVVEHATVSWEHAEIAMNNRVLMIRDLGSHNGTLIGNSKVSRRGARLYDGAELALGDLAIRFYSTDRGGGDPPDARRAHRFSLGADLTIGREPRNDIVLDEPNVSRFHARILQGPPITLEDLGSRNGTRLNNQAVSKTDLQPGDKVGIGPFRLQFDGSNVTVIDDRAGMHLQAEGVSVAVAKNKTILHPTSLTVAPGELLALVGPSGSGKSTLLKTMAAVVAPSSGRVLLSEDPVELRLTDLGYVPQSDTIHEGLTVRECLTYAARLRLPRDTSRSEIKGNVRAIEETLGLGNRTETRIGSLSGGQRKRVSCGVELIGQPTMLLLDEPTSGLDPSFERRLMKTFRALADEGRGLVVVTHATGSLDLCDTVAAMRAGGHLDFLGSPQRALTHYDAERYEEIYERLEQPVAGPSPLQHDASDRTATRKSSPKRKGFARHFRTLTARYFRTMLRDRRTLFALLGQVPVMAVFVAALFPADLLALPDIESGRTAQFVFLLVTCAIWLGLVSSCREIVKERDIILREINVGVRLGAYLASKTIVLIALTTAQVALLLGVSLSIQPLNAETQSYIQLSAILAGAAFAAVGMGLAVSTLARNVDQATSLVPLLLIPQLLFAGAIVARESMQPLVSSFSDAIFARWAFAGAGSSIGLNDRFVEEPAQLKVYGPAFFDVDPNLIVGVLGAFFLVGLVAAGVLLRRRATSSD